MAGSAGLPVIALVVVVDLIQRGGDGQEQDILLARGYLHAVGVLIRNRETPQPVV